MQLPKAPATITGVLIYSLYWTLALGLYQSIQKRLDSTSKQETSEYLTVQIAYNETDVAIVPLHDNFWPSDIPIGYMERVADQVKVLIGRLNC
jgi:hypothetical protein